MAHLGDDVSALVDGQLSNERAEAALAHLVNCEMCAAQVAVERASRRRLSAAADVRPSAELTDRLLRLAQQGAPEPPHGARALAGRAWGPLSSGRVRRRLALRSTALLVGAAGVAGALVLVGTLTQRTGDPAAMLARVGAPDRHQTELVVSVDTLASAPGGGTTAAALAWLAEHGWAAPRTLPHGARITSVTTTEAADGTEVVRLDIVRGGEPAEVLEQRAVLDPDSLAELVAVDLGPHSAYRLPGPESRLVVQSEGVTVLVSAPDPALAASVAAGFPATPPGAGVGDRLGAGWHTIVGWTDLLLEAP